MDIYFYITFGALALVIIVIYFATWKVRRKKRLISRIEKSYGQESTRSYNEPEMRKIARYSELVHDGQSFRIDDITWNDLGMDDVFFRMNHCFSSMGEEELYRILREPCFDGEALSERKRLIRYFETHERERKDLLLHFAEIGRTRKYSLVEYLFELGDLELKPAFSYLYHLVLLIASVGVIFIQPVVGIMTVLAVVIFNLYTYFRNKMKVEAYYASLSAVAFIVKSAEKILSLRLPELSGYQEKLSEVLRPLKRLKADSFWLGASQANQISSNPVYLILDYLRMMTHTDFPVFNKMVRTVNAKREEILKVLHILGFLEAMIAVSSYRKTLPYYCEGALFESAKPSLKLEEVFHPLIKNAVPNSVETGKPVLLTGSNASGKSTFLRTVALAALMAETVVTVPAKAYGSGYFRIFSSMALSDDLLSGESYYIVEIKSLKRILDALSGDPPVLAFVDEVLRGTNTVERIAASSEILRHFSGKNVLIFAATHDVELTKLLRETYTNMHFEEEVLDNEVRFNYRLLPGPATTRNALKLLSMFGYDPEIVRRARESAEHFTEENEWKI